jgi:hypothetical protein
MATKIKYFYNGELIRTSTHIYTHAVLDEKGNCIACRNGRENAQKAKDAQRVWANGERRFAEEAIKAMQAGRSSFFYTSGRDKVVYKFKPDDTVEKFLGYIADAAVINCRIDGYQIVALETK